MCDTHENNPELFRDYRVKYALVQALGASYAELADKVEQWMKEDNDKTILPLLYKDFDPKGKKEMVRRVKVISTLAGAEANDFSKTTPLHWALTRCAFTPRRWFTGRRSW